MSYKTVEVELENGRVQASGRDTLPRRARGLLTLLDTGEAKAALTCGELAGRWATLGKLPAEEANSFADDIEHAHAGLPPLKSKWD